MEHVGGVFYDFREFLTKKREKIFLIFILRGSLLKLEDSPMMEAIKIWYFIIQIAQTNYEN